MIIEQMVSQILQDVGVLDGWTDMFGDAQPAPLVQLITFEEQELGDSRGIVIRESGSIGGDFIGQKVAVSIYFVGLQNRSDAAVCKDRAKAIQNLFFVQQENSDIITVNPQSFALPVMFTESGRPIVNIEIEVLTDRGYC
jgi:hypothetical protein